jgi:RimJ/RimL family protein N-acetyltransferase
MSLETARLLLRPTSVAADDGVARWQIVERASGLEVGSIGFFGQEPDDSVLVGYEIVNGRRSRGLATEALTAVLAYVAATDRAASVVAETELDHVASRRVMEKAGMQLRHTDGGRVSYRFDCRPAVRSAP